MIGELTGTQLFVGGMVILALAFLLAILLRIKRKKLSAKELDDELFREELKN